MSPTAANFLFEVANFLLLAAALGWVLFKPIRAVLDQERQRRAAVEQEQADLRKEAQSLLEEARAARKSADDDIARRRDELLAAAAAEAERIVSEARAGQASERRALETELANRRAGDAAALTGTVARIAGESVMRLLQELDGPDLDAALVRAACDGLRALPGDKPAQVLVESARPLSAQSREQLAQVLGDGFEERELPELGAGVRVTTAAGQIDASAVSIARQATRTVTEKGAETEAPPAANADG